MVANSHLPLITKASQKLYINANTASNSLKNLRYIPDWFIPKETCGNYDDFMLQMQEHYPKLSLKKFIKLVAKEENKIGEGREAKVYSIPQMEDYILRIKKNVSTGFFSLPSKLKPAKNYFYGLNFGQPVADNGKGITINIRAKGKQYSIPNWANCVQGKAYPSEGSVKTFIKHDMALLSEFPQESYDEFIKKLSFIQNATPHSFDFINPNNFIIDYKNKKINIVDTAFKSEKNPLNDYYENNFYRIATTLCDENTLYWADGKTCKKADTYTRKILKKCFTAVNKYENSYPRLKWKETHNTSKLTLLFETTCSFFKKIIEQRSKDILTRRFKYLINNIDNAN